MNVLGLNDSFFLVLLKIFIIFFLILYVGFAAVVIRQVRLMTETLQVGFEGQLRLISFLHFLVAITILIFSFFSL